MLFLAWRHRNGVRERQTHNGASLTKLCFRASTTKPTPRQANKLSWGCEAADSPLLGAPAVVPQRTPTSTKLGRAALRWGQEAFGGSAVDAQPSVHPGADDGGVARSEPARTYKVRLGSKTPVGL